MVVMILTAVHNDQRQWTMDPCLSKVRFQESRVNVCSVYKYFSNKAGHPTKAAFKMPKDLARRKSWLKVLYREDLSGDVRLINAKSPVPTIFPK